MRWERCFERRVELPRGNMGRLGRGRVYCPNVWFSLRDWEGICGCVYSSSLSIFCSASFSLLNPTRKQQQELHSGSECIETQPPPIPVRDSAGDSSQSRQNGIMPPGNQQEMHPVRTADPVRPTPPEDLLTQQFHR